MMIRTVVFAAAVLFAGSIAQAADMSRMPKMASSSFLHELRFGVMDHDRWSPEKNSADINLEAVFAKPLRASGWPDLLLPYLHVGGSVNTRGYTSHAYAGFTWKADLFAGLFAELTFGGAVHNGHSDPGPKQNALGCNVLFRESASLGYKIDQRWRVMGTVEHLSNAGLCNNNRGLTNMGVRAGYAF